MLIDNLIALGFSAGSPTQAGDFVLQDDSDGAGPYIREWLSEQPCPFPEMIRAPHTPEPDDA